MYSDTEREQIRLQVIEYLERTKLSDVSLAALMKIQPSTLKNFLTLQVKPHPKTLKAIEKWLEEYDHVDFRVK